MIKNIICVKWGTKYPSEEVNALFTAVKRNTSGDMRFFCLTDGSHGLAPWIEPLPLDKDPLQTTLSAAQSQLKRRAGALRKVAVFNPQLIKDLDGPILCLDIDILITGSLNEVFTYAPGKVCMPPPFKKNPHIKTKGEGSVIRFDPKLHGFLYEEIATHTNEALAFSLGSEQRYTSLMADRNAALVNFPPEWMVGFVRSCRPPKPLNLFSTPKLPTGTKIVCFPSEPKARDAIQGVRSGIKSTKPTPWIADYL